MTQPFGPWLAPGPDADQQAGDDAERHGDQDQRQRQHGAVPLAEQRDVEEAAAAEQRRASQPPNGVAGEAAAAQTPTQDSRGRMIASAPLPIL